MKKFYALTNLLVIILLILWNYGANSWGINGNTVSSVSSQYSNLFTPASWAFSIWGIIFLGLLAHGIYQVKKAVFDRTGDGFITQMGPWLIIANLANGAWVYFWLMDHIWGSVVLMLLILLSLIILIIRLNMERWDAPLSTIAWVWWPLCMYSGWIAVATIANITVALVKINWQWLFSEITWTIIMIIVAALLNIFMIITRNMREFAAVGVWALAAISVRHWGEIPELQWTALISAIVVFVAISIHGFQNRETNPFTRKTPPVEA
jgi:hypothetical protein